MKRVRLLLFLAAVSAALDANAQAITSVEPECWGHQGGRLITIEGTGLVGESPDFCAEVEHYGRALVIVYAQTGVVLAQSVAWPAAAARVGPVVVTPMGGSAASTAPLEYAAAVRGDADNDGDIDANDITYLNYHLLFGPPTYPLASLCNADANSSGSKEASDMFYVNAYLLGYNPTPGP